MLLKCCGLPVPARVIDKLSDRSQSGPAVCDAVTAAAVELDNQVKLEDLEQCCSCWSGAVLPLQLLLAVA